MFLFFVERELVGEIVRENRREKEIEGKKVYVGIKI